MFRVRGWLKYSAADLNNMNVPLLIERRELPKNILLLILVSMLFLSVLPNSKLMGSIESASLTSLESQIVGLVNGTRAYNCDLDLEKIAFNHTLSDYSFRSAGSSGANATADWIVGQFESFGLEAYKESFMFTNWNVLSKPTLIIDDDGDLSTAGDQTTIASFQCAHYSWPTPIDGSFSDLVILPLPPAANYDEIGVNPINETEWNVIDTTGKILLVGREVRWDYSWELTYKDKLTAQSPAAVIYTWWYDWMSFVPDFFSGAGGRPTLSSFGPYYWDLEIPVGFVNYDEGLWIRNRESSLNVSAQVKIETVIGYGPHYNVIGKLTGTIYPNKFVIVSGHYDTVMCGGFCDNGAGTAGVIELARIFAEANKTGLLRPKYTILFVAFASEEIGLVGSINYVMKHKTDTKNIVAVINMDCIGSDNFYIAETNSATDFDLDELVLKAAEDLEINATSESPGGSDDYVFSNPVWANDFYQWAWGLHAGIGNAKPVKSSTALASYPTFYTELWDIGSPGWIHTSYDNSTSTATLNWVESDDLENHLKVAALSIIRIVREIEYTFAIDSMPTGVTFTVDKISLTTPWLGTFDESTLVSLEMPEIYSIGEARYYWSQWSDGVSSRSRMVTMNANVTLTAHYTGPYHELTVTSSPITGVTFTIDGVLKTTPYSEWLPESSYSLQMPATHDGYVWSHWLEDGNTNRIKTITLSGTIWTGVFVPTPESPPVGGYAYKVEGYAPAQPFTPYLTLIAFLTTAFTIARRKMHRRTE